MSGFEQVGNECWRITLALEPVPAARPRVGKFGTYYPKTYSRWKLNAEEACSLMAAGRQPSDELFYVNVEVIAERPKTTILPAPKGDLDNYVKAALDAITRGQCLWADDRQVVALHAMKRWAKDGETPSTIVTAGLTMGAVWENLWFNSVFDEYATTEDLMNIYERADLL